MSERNPDSGQRHRRQQMWLGLTMGLAAILASNIVGWWTLGLAIPFAEANPLNSHGRQNPVCTSPANQKEAP